MGEGVLHEIFGRVKPNYVSLPFLLDLVSRIHIPGGVLGYKRNGRVRRIFLGLKFSTPVFFWVEDLTAYFLGFEFPPG